jgi:hypothetical protein
VNETANWGKLSDENMSLIFNLTDILKKSEIVQINIKPKSNKAIKNFDSLIKMKYKNKVKLTVGVRGSGEKVQYSITQLK